MTAKCSLGTDNEGFVNHKIWYDICIGAPPSVLETSAAPNLTTDFVEGTGANLSDWSAYMFFESYRRSIIGLIKSWFRVHKQDNEKAFLRFVEEILTDFAPKSALEDILDQKIKKWTQILYFVDVLTWSNLPFARFVHSDPSITVKVRRTVRKGKE